MKKGILIKEGKHWKVKPDNPNKKPMPIPGDWGFTEEMNGQEVEFDNTGGPVKMVIFLGKHYAKQNMSHHKHNKGSGKSQQKQQAASNKTSPVNRRSEFIARAPYNFIPLNETILAAPPKTNHDQFKGNSGYIDVTAQAISPLFIRKGEDSTFFSAGEKHYIPGSSLRGMIRNLVSIISQGKLDQVTNRQLYRRQSKIGVHKKIDAGEGKPEIRGGILYKDENSYRIKLSKEEKIEKPKKGSKKPFHKFREARFQYRKGQREWTFSTGGFPNGKKNKDGESIYETNIWKIPLVDPSLKGTKVDPKVVKGYQEDDTRAIEAPDLILSLELGKIVDKEGKAIRVPNKVKEKEVEVNAAEGVPVFCRVDSAGEIVSFGHARFHRIPYQGSTEDFIHQVGKEEDFTKHIFGTTAFASKVSFGDLPIQGEVAFELPAPAIPQILSSPKPTSFQHYLVQPHGINTGQSHQNTWDSIETKKGEKPVSIRGFKQYWHRSAHGWYLKQPDKSKTNVYSKAINPVKIGTTFKGRIRFTNLTDAELGCLLAALQLPEGLGHKLGMGKPLGLGSVRLETNLTLTDRSKRYQDLFAEGGWHHAETRQEDLSPYTSAFVEHLSQQGQGQYADLDAYWDQDPRMQHLAMMLTFHHTVQGQSASWEERTRYMEIKSPEDRKNEFNPKAVLPEPIELLDPDLDYTKRPEKNRSGNKGYKSNNRQNNRRNRRR